MLTISFIWVITIWTIVLKLPIILSFFQDDTIVKGLYLLYASSIVLFFIANCKSLSDLVNHHFSKKLIAEPVQNSKDSGSVMKTSLDNEEDF